MLLSKSPRNYTDMYKQSLSLRCKTCTYCMMHVHSPKARLQHRFSLLCIGSCAISLHKGAGASCSADLWFNCEASKLNSTHLSLKVSHSYIFIILKGSVKTPSICSIVILFSRWALVFPVLSLPHTHTYLSYPQALDIQNCNCTKLTFTNQGRHPRSFYKINSGRILKPKV